MTYEFLKKNAEFLGRIDWDSTGIYYGCSIYYLYKDKVYEREEHTNQMKYTGETKTNMICEDVGKNLKENNSCYFTYWCGMELEIYEKLCEIYGEKPCYHPSDERG